MDKILAIKNDECLCWKCLQKKNNVHVIEIHEMGYGSDFDGTSTLLQLCEECYQESNPEIWSMEEVFCDWEDAKEHGFTEYKYEKEMLHYINNLPVQSQQFVWNEYSEGWNKNRIMDSQDWIDYELGILPHSKCKVYNMYSPDERKEYKEKYETCKFVSNLVFSDNSKCSKCPFGARGKYGQKCDKYNISTSCYRCVHYEKRTDEVVDMSEEKFNIYRRYVDYQINKK